MKNTFIALALSALFACDAAAFDMLGLGSLNLNVGSTVTKADTTGNTTATFTKEGLFSLTDVSATYMKVFEGFYAKGAVSMRYTDDPAMKGADWFDVQRFTVELGSGTLKAIAGDNYAELSRYTMAAQGRGVFGVIPAWGLTFRPFAARTVSAVDSVRYARYSTGLRAEWESGIWSAGANFVHSFDDRNSVTAAPAFGNVIRNTVYSLSGAANFSRDFRIDGELAASATMDESLTGPWKDSSALYLRSVFNAWDVRGVAEFERAGTGFASLAGFSNTDRMTYRLSLNRQIDDKLSVYAGMERYNDNIDGSKPATLVSAAPKIGFGYYAGSWAANYSFRYIGRHDMANISNNNFVNTLDGFYNLDFLKADGSFENSIYTDAKNDTAGYAANDLNATVKFPVKAWEPLPFTPYIGGSLRFESVRYLDGSDKKDGLNFSRSFRAGVAATAFSAVEFSAAYTATHTDRAQGSDNTRSEFNGSVGAYLNTERTMGFKAEYRKAYYDLGAGTGGYGEEVFKGTVELSF